MQTRAAIRIVVVFCLAMLSWPACGANVIEKMMMPGELSSPHAKLEEDCANCHMALRKEAQTDLCMDCHKPIRQDISQNLGYHGKDAVVKKSECISCHTEHRGREAKLTQLEPISFNHDNTDYGLKGMHAAVTCDDCHEKGKKLRDTPHACFDCHKSDEPHRSQLGTDCAKCHSVQGWRTNVSIFDHSKTRFPLKGKHQQQPCISCHLGEVYKNLPMTCNDCHAIQDAHATRFGTACNDCHSQESWKVAKFDHEKKTRFTLDGAHSKAICSDCHGDDVARKTSMLCVDCHEPQDVHKSQLGKDCGSCHSSASWAQDVKFDHDLTRYPLIGLHAVVACESCHDTKIYKGVKTSCASCHAKDDTHSGRFATKCEGCHSPSGWGRIAFNHGRDTKFGLTGVHARTACYACHTQKNVSDASLATSCISCHKKQDVHRGSFGTDCARCHTTSTFKTAYIRR